MQISVVDQNENTVRLSLKDVDTTIIEEIIDGLNRDSEVVYARYIVDHPDLTDRMIEVKVKEGTVKEAIERAAKAVVDYFSTDGDSPLYSAEGSSVKASSEKKPTKGSKKSTKGKASKSSSDDA